MQLAAAGLLTVDSSVVIIYKSTKEKPGLLPRRVCTIQAETREFKSASSPGWCILSWLRMTARYFKKVRMDTTKDEMGYVTISKDPVQCTIFVASDRCSCFRSLGIGGAYRAETMR